MLLHYWALSSGIKVVLFLLTISALLGFTLVPIQYAEGAVSWNGFLKEIGFGSSQVYEVIGKTTISAGETDGETITLLCDEGDWRIDDVNFVTVPPIFVDAIIVLHDTATVQILDPASVESTGIALSKKVGYSTLPQLIGSGTPLGFDIEATITILCFSPSPFMTVGGEWQATDTTALIIGYSVLNAYWLAPTAIGIGVGVYLVKRKF